MFKFVVLCVFAAAVAEPEPGFFYGAPLPYSTYPAVVPTTTIKQAGLIAQPSLVYSSPYVYSHFIKKRSADPEPEAKPEPEANPEPEAKPDPQLLAYTSPNFYYPNTYTTPAINPFINTYSNYYPYPQIPLATHFIKKRSAQFIAPTTYVPSTYAVPSYNPYYPTTYLGNKFYPGAVTADTVVYGQHLIKKRSAVLPYTTPYAAPYALPTSYYGNYYGNYPAVPTTYVGNYYAGAPVVGVHAIKKRSAQLLAPSYYTPTTYAAPSPVYTSTYTAGSPVVSSFPYVASPYAYSTYIKK